MGRAVWRKRERERGGGEEREGSRERGKRTGRAVGGDTISSSALLTHCWLREKSLCSVVGEESLV